MGYFGKGAAIIEAPLKAGTFFHEGRKNRGAIFASKDAAFGLSAKLMKSDLSSGESGKLFTAEEKCLPPISFRRIRTYFRLLLSEVGNQATCQLIPQPRPFPFF